MLLVFCGNNRRQRLWHEWRGKPFANDHLDAFFNAGVDAGIALRAFVLAAEAQGLGTCPYQRVRNRAADVSALLSLPQHVFPVAGSAVGWPARAPAAEHAPAAYASPCIATVIAEVALRDAIDDYDRRREAAQPYREQRYVEISERPSRMAGPRTRPGNMPYRSAPTSARMFARGVSSSTSC